MLPCFPYGCAHTCSWAWGFLCFLPALRPPSGSWYTGSSGFSSPLGFPTFAMGPPLRGRGLFVLDRNEGLVSPFGSGTLVSSWLDLPPLSAGVCAPCPSGYVARWSSLCPYPSVILSSLQGSSLPRSVLPPRPLLGVWGFLSYPTLFSAGWGWCLGRWLCFALCSRWCPLSGCTSLRLRVLGDSWFSPLCSPDRRSASRFTYPALTPVNRLSFRLGDFSFG